METNDLNRIRQLSGISEAPDAPTAKISKDTFLDFLYQDNDDITDLGEDMVKQLAAYGQASISLNSIWERTGFIRSEIIQNLDEIPEDLIDDDDEIADPGAHLNVEWL